jgi:signal transduction histidine kinase
VGQVEIDATADAIEGGFGLAIERVDPDVYIDADPCVLQACIAELIQNAFRHSRTHGHVALTTVAAAGRVLIEVEDECGGLSPGESAQLFQPHERRRLDPTREGVGLAVNRCSIEKMGGEIWVRDLPGKGCVFTLDLPRCSPP